MTDTNAGETFGKSATWLLVDAIEAQTSTGWSQEKRAAVADLIRAYRMEQTGFVVLRIQKLVREAGDQNLSEKIHYGKY